MTLYQRAEYQLRLYIVKYLLVWSAFRNAVLFGYQIHFKKHLKHSGSKVQHRVPE